MACQLEGLFRQINKSRRPRGWKWHENVGNHCPSIVKSSNYRVQRSSMMGKWLDFLCQKVKFDDRVTAEWSRCLNKSCYQFHRSHVPVTWQEAKTECEERGETLVNINDSPEAHNLHEWLKTIELEWWNENYTHETLGKVHKVFMIFNSNFFCRK